MSDPADYMLATTGDNYYELLEDVRELQRIKAMLDSKAPWTAVTHGEVEAGPAERVDALLRAYNFRSVINE